MACVLKVKYADTLHRIIVKPNSSTGEVNVCYAELEQKIRNLFKVQPDVVLVLTYKDREGDVVTISEDEDLEDALVIQGLNPLRIDVENGEVNLRCHKREKSDGGFLGTEKDKETRSTSVQQFPSSASMLEKTFLPTLDSLKNVASGELSNLSEKLNQDGTLQAKLLSEFLQVFIKANTKGSKGKSNSENQGMRFSSSPKEVANNKEAKCSDPAVDFCANAQAVPNPCRGSLHGHRNYQDEVFHHGVQCDLCGVVPIVGPRYKSNKRDNFDLCVNCFTETEASEAYYTRYDQPLKHVSGQFSSFHLGKTPRCPYFSPHVFGRPGFGKKKGFHARRDHRAFNQSNIFGKLDCRFVRDVTVFDGTELAPRTSFTKIWRLRNSGNIPWPQNTQLVHVGGDELGSDLVAPLELPEGGLHPDGEIEASVDLVAPENSGRYISYWRLMAPSSVKFGHKVWLSIQVVPKDTRSLQILEPLKPDTEKKHQRVRDEPSYGAAAEDVVLEEILDNVSMQNTANSSKLNCCFEVNKGPSAPVVDILDRGEVQKNVKSDTENYSQEKFVNENTKTENSELGAFSLVDIPNNSTTADASMASRTPSKASLQVSYFQTEIDPSSTNIDDPASDALNQLEAMGFTDRILNLELLEKNDYNLQIVLDELFSAADWDHMLDELQEME